MLPDPAGSADSARAAPHGSPPSQPPRARVLQAAPAGDPARRGPRGRGRRPPRCDRAAPLAGASRDPTQPNLRQVHLIPGELFEEVLGAGHRVLPGDLGENVTTSGVDLLALPTGTVLLLGDTAEVVVTGLRNPCRQIDDFQGGLLRQVLCRDADGAVVRRAGVMGVVRRGGEVRPGDPVPSCSPAPVLPDGPHRSARAGLRRPRVSAGRPLGDVVGQADHLAVPVRPRPAAAPRSGAAAAGRRPRASPARCRRPPGRAGPRRGTDRPGPLPRRPRCCRRRRPPASRRAPGRRRRGRSGCRRPRCRAGRGA